MYDNQGETHRKLSCKFNYFEGELLTIFELHYKFLLHVQIGDKTLIVQIMAN